MDAKMELLVITGLSGAGKSQAVRVIEDMGYYCIDNIPPALIGRFFEVCAQTDGKLRKVERPKKKNPLHLQKTLTTVELAEITNKKLRSALSVLNRSADNIAEESDKLV